MLSNFFAEAGEETGEILIKYTTMRSRDEPVKTVAFDHSDKSIVFLSSDISFACSATDCKTEQTSWQLHASR